MFILLQLFFSIPCFHSNFEIFVKVHQKKMVIINFANKWEIIIIRDKKNRDKFFVRWKKIGERYWSGKISSGKNLITCKKFSHFSPDFFFPDKVLLGFKSKAVKLGLFSNTFKRREILSQVKLFRYVWKYFTRLLPYFNWILKGYGKCRWLPLINLK